MLELSLNIKIEEKITINSIFSFINRYMKTFKTFLKEINVTPGTRKIITKFGSTIKKREQRVNKGKQSLATSFKKDI